MPEQQTPLAAAGRTSAQDALQISGSSDKRCSQDQTPVPRAGHGSEGGSIQISTLEAIFDPLAYCPAKLRARYGGAGDRALAGGYPAAVKLKCLDCCGWEYTEAKRCNSTDCPLWMLNRRIFGARTPSEKEPS
jgi:hypothetical protein